MKKPWSITTTVRNPGRLRDFLIALKKLEYSEWNSENQQKYQILLIQNRLYGYGSRQFYNGLSQESINLIRDPSREILLEQARQIFNAKNYEDPAMRGRQSINPLKKFGFVIIKCGKVKITDLGKLFLEEDFDLDEIFFRSFLKWQIPNPDSRVYKNDARYDIKPFIGALHLINAVNQMEITRGNKPKGISKKEFSLFAPTLVHYQNINSHAEMIIALRDELSGETEQRREIFGASEKQFASEFLETDDENEIEGLLSNLRDYGDNAIRYFRLTRYIYIRGGGFYVDLEHRRAIEIGALLNYDNAQSRHFDPKEQYFTYISDFSEPQLPWETKEKYIEIIENLVKETREYESALQKENAEIKDFRAMQIDELKNYVTELRVYRQKLQNKENYKKSQAVEQINSYIRDLENIFGFEDRPVLLEKLSALGLHALNDALNIQPNYPVGDDNEPTFTAPANTPDIECFYESFNAICEVTMLKGRNQWYNEGQPVMRHLRDFEEKHSDKLSYCLFIAPTLHRDTINTFWMAIKYEYEGSPQKIIPLSISQFISVLKVLVQLKSEKKFLPHTEISRLYDEILDSSESSSNSNEWLDSIPSIISKWQETLNLQDIKT